MATEHGTPRRIRGLRARTLRRVYRYYPELCRVKFDINQKESSSKIDNPPGRNALREPGARKPPHSRAIPYRFLPSCEPSRTELRCPRRAHKTRIHLGEIGEEQGKHRDRTRGTLPDTGACSVRYGAVSAFRRWCRVPARGEGSLARRTGARKWVGTESRARGAPGAPRNRRHHRCEADPAQHSCRISTSGTITVFRGRVSRIATEKKRDFDRALQ